MKSKDQNAFSSMIDDIKYLSPKYLGRVTPAIGFQVEKPKGGMLCP
jgi:hypothetical protein